MSGVPPMVPLVGNICTICTSGITIFPFAPVSLPMVPWQMVQICYQPWVPLENPNRNRLVTHYNGKSVGAFRAYRTEKVGAFRANKTRKRGFLPRHISVLL